VTQLLPGGAREIVAQLSAAKEWVRDTFGTAEQMFMSAVLPQTDTDNFISQKASVQRETIENALHLSAISSLCDALDESRKAHKYVLGVADTARKMLREQHGPLNSAAEVEADAAAQSLFDAERARAAAEEALRGLAARLGDAEPEVAAAVPAILPRPDVSDEEAAAADRNLALLSERRRALGDSDSAAEDSVTDCEIQYRLGEHMADLPPAPAAFGLQYISKREEEHRGWLAGERWSSEAEAAASRDDAAAARDAALENAKEVEEVAAPWKAARPWEAGSEGAPVAAAAAVAAVAAAAALAPKDLADAVMDAANAVAPLDAQLVALDSTRPPAPTTLPGATDARRRLRTLQ
jgi:DNA repair exonuclease SbcCD ATPase subunit